MPPARGAPRPPGPPGPPGAAGPPRTDRAPATGPPSWPADCLGIIAGLGRGAPGTPPGRGAPGAPSRRQPAAEAASGRARAASAACPGSTRTGCCRDVAAEAWAAGRELGVRPSSVGASVGRSLGAAACGRRLGRGGSARPRPGPVGRGAAGARQASGSGAAGRIGEAGRRARARRPRLRRSSLGGRSAVGAAFLAGAFLAAFFAAFASAAAFHASPCSSVRRRTTGGSTVEEADLTNSPISLSAARTSLLGTPNSLASSWTLALATFLLLGRSVPERARTVS